MFIAEYKSERLWKHLDGSAIIPGPGPRDHPTDVTTTKESSAIPTLDKKYSPTNAARLRQLLRDCQAISTQKNVPVMEKYESMLNLNVEIRVQKPELAFRDEHLINFLLASTPSTYEGIIDNLNMRDTLTLDSAVRALRTKETELLQINAEAKNDVLKKYRSKHGSHANLATATVDPNTPEKDQKKVITDVWKDLESQAKTNLR